MKTVILCTAQWVHYNSSILCILLWNTYHLLLAKPPSSPYFETNLTPGWKSVFCWPLWWKVSNLFNLWLQPASLLGVKHCWEFRNVLYYTGNHIQWWCHDVLEYPCTSLQQGEKLNPWRSRKPRGGVKLFFKCRQGVSRVGSKTNETMLFSVYTR